MYDTFSLIFNNPYAWLTTPLLIFCARATDVSLATLRALLVARGVKQIAPIIGFFEALIWLTAIGQIMKNLDNPLSYVGYALGFATGTFVGMRLEERLAMGTLLVRAMINEEPSRLVGYLHSLGFGATVVPGSGYSGDAYIIFSVIERKRLPEIVATIQNVYPKAFYTTENVVTPKHFKAALKH